MTTQTKIRGVDATSVDGRAEDTGFEAATETAVTLTGQAQDSILAMMHQSRDGLLATVRLWTESVGYLVPSGAATRTPAPADLVRSGYDLVERLLVAQRRFVTALLTPADR